MAKKRGNWKFRNRLKLKNGNKVSEKQAVENTIVKEIIEQVEKMQNGEVINVERLMIGIVQKNVLEKRLIEEEQIILQARQRLEDTQKISCLKDGEYIKDEYGIIVNDERMIDSIKETMINQIEKMQNGEQIEFGKMMAEITQKHNMTRSHRIEKQLICEVRQMLKARRKISCLKDEKYVRDEYGIIADQETAAIKREEAIQVAERIKKEIEAEGEKPTKEEILKRLDEDFKENQLYRTWITVLCSNGTLLGKKEEVRQKEKLCSERKEEIPIKEDEEELNR